MSKDLNNLHTSSFALLTDYYQLTMAYGYWAKGLHLRPAAFTLFFRRAPFGGGFTIAAGLQPFIEFLQSFRYTEEDIAYLESLRVFPKEFLRYLYHMRFECDIDAAMEGTLLFPYEPLVRVKGPLLQAQLLESPLLNFINFSSLIATKAARMRVAAQQDTLLEFGLRRAQGVDGALTASRSAYIGGCDATSNVLAAKRFSIPLQGTHSHSWVMVFEEEMRSFEALSETLPVNPIFLVDTYSSIEGIKRAIICGKKLQSRGYSLGGVRLDSGDLTYLSREARYMLDEAGFTEAKIVASSELDEHLIAEMKGQGAKIDIWGVGTHLVTGQNSPALDGVYKLSAIQDERGAWQYRLKLSEQMRKISNPGFLQTARFSEQGVSIADAIFDSSRGLPIPCHLIDPMDPTRQRVVEIKEYRKLLVPIVRRGELVSTLPTLAQIKKEVESNLKSFSPGVLRLINPHHYPVGMERGLYELKIDLISKVRKGISSL